MEIIWFGHSCFKLKGKKVSVVCDPYDEKIGIKPAKKLEADIVTVSHQHYDHNNIKIVGGSPFIIDGPGEFEIKEVSIFGIPSFHDKKQGQERGKNTIFLIEMEGVRICHLGDLGHLLSEEELEQLDGVDVLLIPVGGIYTISSKEAVELISEIEPKIVIPMHYRFGKLNLDIEGIENFCKESGAKEEFIEKLSLNKNTLPQEGGEIVLLKPKVKP